MTRRAALAVGRGLWPAAVQGLSTDGNAAVRASVAELAFDAGDARLGPIAAELVGDPAPDVARHAERAILALAFRVLAASEHDLAGVARRADRFGLSDAVPIESDPDHVFEAAARAGGRFDTHRRRGVLLAALVLLDRRVTRFGGGPGRNDGRAALATWFHALDAETLGVMRTVLLRAGEPVIRRRALEHLHRPALSAACARRLARALSPAEHEAVLPHSHLLLHPGRSWAARTVEPGVRVGTRDGVPSVRFASAGGVPEPAAVPGLSVEARRGLPRWLTALGVPDEARAAVLAAAPGDADNQARLAAALATPPSHLADLAFDATPAVGRAAALRWADAPSPADNTARARLGTLLARCPDAFVRRMGREVSTAALGAWGEASAAWLAAHARVRADAPAFIIELREALATGDEPRRVRALQIARRARLAESLAPAIIACTQDPSPRVASAACAALTHVAIPEAAKALAAALSAVDARVRANAAEAIARGSTRRAAVLIEHKDDPHHRVRATILRAATQGRVPSLTASAAVESLAAMLDDARAEHRRAGAWAATRVIAWRRPDLDPGPLTLRLDALASADEDGGVRARAAAGVAARRALAESGEPA